MDQERLEKLEKEIAIVKERNKRVEADKAWEKSPTRIGTICVITYFLAALILYSIGIKNYWLNALLPTFGFFMSVQTLPFLKRWWVNKYLEKRR